MVLEECLLLVEKLENNALMLLTTPFQPEYKPSIETHKVSTILS